MAARVRRSGRAPTQLRPSSDPASTRLRPSSDPAPTQLPPSSDPAPTQLRPSFDPAPTQLRPSTDPAPTQLRPSSDPAPTQLRPSSDPAPTQLRLGSGGTRAGARLRLPPRPAGRPGHRQRDRGTDSVAQCGPPPFQFSGVAWMNRMVRPGKASRTPGAPGPAPPRACRLRCSSARAPDRWRSGSSDSWPRRPGSPRRRPVVLRLRGSWRRSRSLDSSSFEARTTGLSITAGIGILTMRNGRPS